VSETEAAENVSFVQHTFPQVLPSLLLFNGME